MIDPRTRIAEASKGGRRLLLVEDEATLGRALERFCERAGAVVRRVVCLADARKELESGGFDAYVIDRALPDGDGLSLLERVPASRTVVMSASPERKQCAGLGIQHTLCKPFELNAFAEVVGSLMEGSAASAPVRSA